ncbi:trypsin-like serine peptidase [Antarctobacter jejuensis]|uniref:trypsin-like serine peptidase n=1 Tax=Antarctobacter jejuensis TaxID=1439938 RepID=UPI003FD359EC
MKRLVALFLLLGGPVFAQAHFDVMDRRGELLGWSAVGRIDTGTGYCTGTLIARDLVLTAAHCVYDEAGREIPAQRLRFRAGYHRGTEIAARGVRRWVVSPGYVATAGRQLDGKMIATDVALLQLDRDIHGTEADPFSVHDRPVKGSEVSVVSYGEGRSEVLSRERRCAVTERYAGGVLAFDCDVTFGSSGSPVFAHVDGRLRIMSVISAVGEDADGAHRAYGMVLPAQVAGLRKALRREGSSPVVAQGARRVKVGEGAKRVRVGERTGTGARFVRP